MGFQSNQKHEQAFLDFILDVLQKNIEQLKIDHKDATDKLYDLYSKYSPDTPEYYMDIPFAENMVQFFKKELEFSQKSYSAPYFGKIIYHEEAEPGILTLYIGKKGLLNQTSPKKEQLIIDWRAPVAEVYYNSRLGRTNYEAPQGIISIDLKLKTTLKIKDGVLVNFYDAEVISNDELLAEYLSQTKDTVLNDIVATIQEDQNKIIRKDLKKNIIVQGVAGSGKTTVALHRISYLLYHFKDQLTFENVYLIAANKLFLNYITSMLPDLDVPVIKQGTMKEVLLDAIAHYDPKFHCGPESTAHRNPVYNNETFIPAFRDLMDGIEKELFPNTAISVLDFEFLPDNHNRLYAQIENLKFSAKAKILDDMLLENIRRQKEDIIRYVSENRQDSEVEAVLIKLFGLKKDAILLINIQKNFSRFVGKFKHYYLKRVKKLKCKELFTRLTGSHTISSINDLACYLLLLVSINGPAYGNDIKHVVIDEAQDFSTVVYYCLKELCARSTFTIVGDVMQNIHEGGINSWANITDTVFVKSTEYIEMLKSYRNTIEISNFAKKVVEYYTTNPFEIDPIIRHGKPVGVHPFVSKQERIYLVKDTLKAFKEAGNAINAVICKDDAEAKMLYAQLQSEPDIRILDANASALQYGNYIMSLQYSKGLEFDGVILWDFDRYQAGEYKQLYVAMTRALHQLHVLTNNKDILAFA